MKKQLIVNTILLPLFSIFTSYAFAVEKNISEDPHRTKAGFFDIHICNWPDRPPFYLTLFGTEQYDDITSIEILSPDDKKIGELNLKKFTVSKKKNKPERHVFLTQLDIPKNKMDGWYSARINFRDKPSQTAYDFVIHQTLNRATSHSPEHGAEDIKKPKQPILGFNSGRKFLQGVYKRYLEWWKDYSYIKPYQNSLLRPPSRLTPSRRLLRVESSCQRFERTRSTRRF